MWAVEALYPAHQGAVDGEGGVNSGEAPLPKFNVGPGRRTRELLGMYMGGLQPVAHKTRSQVRMSENVRFSADFVRSTPDSGRKWVAVFLSANDPLRTFVVSHAHQNKRQL